MDLSVFLILLFVTLQFVAEYRSWNQTRVKLGLFVSTVIITLPNIVFMVIDWWRSPHSKIAILVLNTFQPILRGETYRLFRWLKARGINLASDDINHLPITRSTPDPIHFYVTKECSEKAPRYQEEWIVVDNERDHIDPREILGVEWNMVLNKSTLFLMGYQNGVFHVSQHKFSKKLSCLHCHSYVEFRSNKLYKSSLMCEMDYKVDEERAALLRGRLGKLVVGGIPILQNFQDKDPVTYFDVAPTLANLNGNPGFPDPNCRDLVLVRWTSDCFAVG